MFQFSDVFDYYNIMPTGVLPALNMVYVAGTKRRAPLSREKEF
jgi:hypothetical protein